MTETLTRPHPAEPDRSRPDRSVLLLVGTGVLVLLVVGAVLVFGVVRPPSLSPLADDPTPAPSTSIAYLTERPDGTCLGVARPDGSTVGPWCDAVGGEVVGWDEQGILLRRWDAGESVRVIDPETGQDLGRAPGPAWREPSGDAAVWTQYRDGQLTVRADADDTVLWRVEASDRYEIRRSSRSADGAWIAMIDAADRLLVVPADGSAPPRVWVTDVPEWHSPVWEGTSSLD